MGILNGAWYWNLTPCSSLAPGLWPSVFVRKGAIRWGSKSQLYPRLSGNESKLKTIRLSNGDGEPPSFWADCAQVGICMATGSLKPPEKADLGQWDIIIEHRWDSVSMVSKFLSLHNLGNKNHVSIITNVCTFIYTLHNILKFTV